MSITTAALLAWSSLRSWRAKNNFLKWGATGLAALLSIVVTPASVIMIAGLLKLRSGTMVLWQNADANLPIAREKLLPAA
jgi:hypothetical protein